MRFAAFYKDQGGTTAIEFGLTAPVYFGMIIVIIMGGLLFWTQTGLQHGAEMAARCASIDKVLCNSESAIQNYAASQAFGLNPNPKIFTVSTASCGNLIIASYDLAFITKLFGVKSIALDARSCFPK